jgi:hypothetical protein
MRNSDKPGSSLKRHRYSNLIHPAREYEDEETGAIREETAYTKWKSRRGNMGEGNENKQEARTS